MLNPNHPDDERLSALASRDDDAVADPELTAHVSTCDRCADLVAELALLRVSLAELPDLAPSRPLRLLPPDQRAAVVLCDVYGMDYNEVAAMTDSALGTVKSRIHRGRLRLRELMADHRELFTS